MTAEATTDRTTDGEMEFTYAWYGSFLDRLLESGRRFRDYDADLAPGDVVLRHDVDWSPRKALRTARMEADRDIEATYFFLVSSPFYNLVHKPNRQLIDRLEALGHDVGLHFSTHQYWDDEPAEARLLEQVAAEQRILEQVAADPVETVSFHRPPEWVFRRTFPTFDSTYEERFFTDVAYRGDSNQRWREEPPLTDGVPEKMQVLTHPGLWGEDDAPFADRLATLTDRTLGRTRRFMHDQFVEKKYNVDAFCDFDEPTDVH
jgi:peptidoglycan/xylan/chitin deacetylase (PgdA/CDA1 family)